LNLRIPVDKSLRRFELSSFFNSPLLASKLLLFLSVCLYENFALAHFMRPSESDMDPPVDPMGGFVAEDIFQFFLTHEISRAVRYRHFFSVCLVGVNSGSGGLRSQGTEFLRTMFKALREKLRTTDTIGLLQHGFGIILLNVADESALRVADRVKSHLRQVVMPRDSRADINHTVSVGGACFPRDGQTEAALLTHASQCLDAARLRGGNRVVYHPDEL